MKLKDLNNPPKFPASNAEV